MENDRLAKWRRQPATGQEPVTKNQEPPTVYPFTPREQGGLKPYKAFETKDRQHRLRMKGCTDGNRHSASYHVLLDVVSNEACTYLALIYSFMVVEITGKNLEEGINAVEMETCSSIQSFSPHLFAQPTDQAAPFIEKIEVTVNEKRSR